MKLVLLLAYSVALLCVSSWIGILCAIALFLILYGASRVPIRTLAVSLIPLAVILFFILLFNGIRPLDAPTGDRFSLGSVTDPLCAGWASIALVYGLGFSPSGFELGCFYSIRIALIVMAGLIVSFTSSATELTRAFAWFLRPLARLGLKVDDIAMTFAVALRFIPLTMEELERLRRAQLSRGAGLERGPFWRRIRAWGSVFIPLFVGLFRRAESVALAFDLRCYGMSERRTSLHEMRFSATDGLVLAIGLACCVLIVLL